MYKKEVMVAISIFFILLIGAWWLNDQTKSDYGNYKYENDPDGTVRIQTINNGLIGEENNLYPPFRPREYIRVNSRPGGE